MENFVHIVTLCKVRTYMNGQRGFISRCTLKEMVKGLQIIGGFMNVIPVGTCYIDKSYVYILQ